MPSDAVVQSWIDDWTPLVAEWLHGRPIYEVLLERSLRLAGHLPRAPSTTVSSPVGIDERTMLRDPLDPDAAHRDP